MDIKEKAVKEHLNWQGKIEIVSRVKLQDKDDLSVAYTPGVAQPCLEIEKNPDLSYSMTRRGNLVAVIRVVRGTYARILPARTPSCLPVRGT